MQTHGNLSGFHVAPADDEHRVDAQLFRVGDLRLERRRAEIGFHPHHVRAEFGHDGLGVVDQRLVVVERDDAHLIRREPEREVAGVMLDEEADEPLVRAERRAMDAQRRLVRVVLVAVGEAELGGHGEVHLVRGDGEFAADGAPHLHVNLRPVERRLVGDLHVVDAGFDQHLAHHVLGLLPQLRLVDVFLAQAFRRVRC